MWCPSQGTEPREERIDPEQITADYQAVKKLLGEVIGRYNRLHTRDAILLECWEREAKKRGGN